MYLSLLKKTFIYSLFVLSFGIFAQENTGIEEVVVTAEKESKTYKMFHHQ